MLALGTLVLLRDPENFARIRNEPESVDAIVEELLRYLTVVQVAFPRFAKHDQELFGQQVKKGDLVAVSLAGADRDKLVFGDDAEDFWPRRAAPAAHLAFGHGMHRCVGAELARMELRAAFSALANRFPDLSLAIPEENSASETSPSSTASNPSQYNYTQQQNNKPPANPPSRWQAVVITPRRLACPLLRRALHRPLPPTRYFAHLRRAKSDHTASRSLGQAAGGWSSPRVASPARSYVARRFEHSHPPGVLRSYVARSATTALADP